MKTRRALALAEKQEAERPLSLSACESCARTREPLEPSGTHSRSRAAPRHREHRVAARPGGVPALAVSRLVSAVRFKSIRFGRSIVQTYSSTCPVAFPNSLDIVQKAQTPVSPTLQHPTGILTRENTCSAFPDALAQMQTGRSVPQRGQIGFLATRAARSHGQGHLRRAASRGGKVEFR